MYGYDIKHVFCAPVKDFMVTGGMWRKTIASRRQRGTAGSLVEGSVLGPGGIKWLLEEPCGVFE